MPLSDIHLSDLKYLIPVVVLFAAGFVLSWLSGRFGARRINVLYATAIVFLAVVASMLLGMGLIFAGVGESAAGGLVLIAWMAAVAAMVMRAAETDFKTGTVVALIVGAMYAGYAVIADLAFDRTQNVPTHRQSADAADLAKTPATGE